MPTLIQHRPRRGTVSLLVLRLAVAGVLAWAGANRLSPNAPPIAENPPIELPGGEVLDESLTTLKEIAAPILGSDASSPATVSKDGVKFDLSWNTVTGAGELGLAAVLLLGFFTRFVSLVGLTAVTGSALAAREMVTLPDNLDPLVRMFEANPAAALLLGSIFLALFVGGSGPVAIDRVWRRRRHKDTGAELADAG